jgi:hypothetical protein
MAQTSRDFLLQEMNSHIRSFGQGGKTTAEDLRSFLTSLIDRLGPVLESSVLTAPAAPTAAQSDDSANTFTCTLNPSYTAAEHEYTLDGGESWLSPVVLPITVGNVELGANMVGVRVKATASRQASATLYAGGFTMVQMVLVENVDWNTGNCTVTVTDAGGKAISANGNGSGCTSTKKVLNAGNGLRASLSFIPTSDVGYDNYGFYPDQTTNLTSYYLKYGFECATSYIWFMVNGNEIHSNLLFIPGVTRLKVELWSDSVRWFKDEEEIHRENTAAPEEAYYFGVLFYTAGGGFRDATIGAQTLLPR